MFGANVSNVSEKYAPAEDSSVDLPQPHGPVWLIISLLANPLIPRKY